MVRQYLLKTLTERLGPPCKRSEHEWWIVGSGQLDDLHICLNQVMNHGERAHLLIFDPSAAEARKVVELWPSTIRDAEEAVEYIEHLIKSRKGYTSEAE